MDNSILDFLKNKGFSPLAIVIILILTSLLFNYDKSKMILSDFYNLLAKTFGWCKRKAIKGKIESCCMKSFKDILQEVPEIHLPKLVIEWIGKDNKEIHFKEGEAIVLLKYDRDSSQNILNVTTTYIKKGFLRTPKTYMSMNTKDAIDFMVIKKCLLNNDKNSLFSFIEDSQKIDNETRETIDKVSNLDESGLMTRILFREYQIWGDKLYPKLCKKEYLEESDDFLEYLYNISSREPEDDTQLQFIRDNFKVGVILVAKYETYNINGAKPYVKRIKEGFAKNINTFYLLAKNDKVEIVRKVYSELISSGDYNLINKPKKFNTKKGEQSICYCLEVNISSNLAKASQQINDAMELHDILDAVVTYVHHNILICNYNNIEVYIPSSEISENNDIKLYCYFKKGNSIRFKPLKYDEDGRLVGSIKDTDSNPEKFIKSKYTVGSLVEAVVQKNEGNKLNLLLKDSAMNSIAYRKDITNSNFVLLKDLYPVKTSVFLQIKEIDYVNNLLILKDSKLLNPWCNFRNKENDLVNCIVYQIRENAVVTELEDGITAILPNSEMSWFSCEIDKEKEKYKIGSLFSCQIKKILPDKKLVILTKLSGVSPYQKYINENKGDVDAVLYSSSSYGLCGLINEKYNLFIPLSETHIGDINFKNKFNRKIKVRIKNIADDRHSFIGTLKPYIKAPIVDFCSSYTVGVVLKNLFFYKVTSKNVFFNIRYGKKEIPAILNISDISNNCCVGDLKLIFRDNMTIPLVIKEIDVDNNTVKLSVKQLFEMNNDRMNNLDYLSQYQAFVIGKSRMKYCIILKDIWIEGFLETESTYTIGSHLSLRLSTLSSSIPIFTDE